MGRVATALSRRGADWRTVRRRWARGPLRYDFSYYTFNEYVTYVKGIGFSKDSHGNEGFEAVALQLWNGSVDEWTEQRLLHRRRRKLAEDVARLPPFPLESLTPRPGESSALFAQARVVLELVEGGAFKIMGSPGNSLRVRDDCVADCLGGAGPWATFVLQVVAALPLPRVRLFSPMVAASGLGQGFLRTCDEGLDCDGSTAGPEVVFDVRSPAESTIVLSTKDTQ